jgi:hypothetical protein
MHVCLYQQARVWPFFWLSQFVLNGIWSKHVRYQAFFTRFAKVQPCKTANALCSCVIVAAWRFHHALSGSKEQKTISYTWILHMYTSESGSMLTK